MKTNILPTARKSNLVVQDADKELLIYDVDRHKAFCLNETLRLILEQCDGKTTFEQASANIKKVLRTDLDNQIFWMALGQLKRNHLLDELEPIPEIPKVSRRDLVMSTMALGISLPAVFALGVSPPQGLISTGQCITNLDNCPPANPEFSQGVCCPGLRCYGTNQVCGACVPTGQFFLTSPVDLCNGDCNSSPLKNLCCNGGIATCAASGPEVPPGQTACFCP